jgi:chemotaxis signal transduction protein
VNFLELEVDGDRYAIALERVDRVLPRVWLTPLADAPADVEGFFAVDGHVAVAIDGRKRLARRHGRVSMLDEHMVVLRGTDARPERARLALIVDRVYGVRTIDVRAIDPPPLPHPRLKGALVLDDGLVLTLDAGAILSEDELARLDGVLARHAPSA